VRDQVGECEHHHDNGDIRIDAEVMQCGQLLDQGVRRLGYQRLIGHGKRSYRRSLSVS
jgi:hypothetical protein